MLFLFDRYLLFNFLKLFSAVSFVGVFLVSLYALLDFLLGFKVKEPSVGLRYFLFLLPLGFYYVSPALLSVALFIFLRRLLERKVDLIAQSFTLSPLRFSLPFLTFGLILSFLFLAGNQFLFPSLAGELWRIEKTYKKKQEAGGIVRNFWFLKEEGGERTYYYIGSLDLSSGVVYDFKALTVYGEYLTPVSLLEVETGLWREEKVFVLEGKRYDFRRGKEESVKGKSVRTGLKTREVELFSERMDFLPLTYLYALARKGSAYGFNAQVYLGELAFRVLFSFFPFVLTFFTLYAFLKHRELKKVVPRFLVLLPFLWTSAILPKLLTQKGGYPFYYAFLPLLGVSLFLLKGLYDLKKGFRV